MGFEEYNLIKSTMLEVAEKNNSIEAIKSEMDGVKSRKKRIRKEIKKLRKDIKEMKPKFSFDKKTVKKYESEIISSELALNRSSDNMGLALAAWLISWFILIPLSAIVFVNIPILTTDQQIFLFFFFLVGPFATFLLPTLGVDETKFHEDNILDRKNLLEGFNSLPQEVEKLEKSISKKNEKINESETEIEDFEKDIEKIYSEITELMDSIKHLIPYADKI
jgi:chromosome segregation ATPase